MDKNRKLTDAEWNEVLNKYSYILMETPEPIEKMDSDGEDIPLSEAFDYTVAELENIFGIDVTDLLKSPSAST